MVRLAATAVVSVIANAIALLMAAVLVDRVTVQASGFIVAVLVFTAVSLVVEPLVRQVAIKNVPAMLGGTALIATLISLVVASLIGDGLSIEGSTTWVMATVVVWMVALILRLMLPLVMFKEILRRSPDEEPAV